MEETQRLLEDFVQVNMRQHLGSGTHGQVFKGTQLSAGLPVAVKFIYKNGLDTDKVGAINKEVIILSSCHHESVITLHDFFETEERFAMVLEFCEGADLFEFVSERQRLEEDIAARIMKEITSGVLYLHSHSIVHRDLKLENVMFKNLPQVTSPIKLVDFGFATFASDGESVSSPCGTPGYVAPEIARNYGSYGKSVDIWSIGVLLYIMLAGFPPFYSDDDQELLQIIARGHYSFPPRTWSTISHSATSLVRGLLKKNPQKRLHPQQILVNPWILGERTFLPGETYEDGNLSDEDDAYSTVVNAKTSLSRSLHLQRVCTPHQLKTHHNSKGETLPSFHSY